MFNVTSKLCPKGTRVCRSTPKLPKLFENSIFDSLDYTQLVSLIESVGYQFNIKKNDYRIPRNINEINKILSKKKLMAKFLK